jgi:excisionase family DNA binding protein
MRSIVSTSNKTILDSSYLLSKRDRAAALKLEEAKQFIREMAGELADFVRLCGTGLAALMEAASVKISEVRTSKPAVAAVSTIELNSKPALTVKEAAELLSISVSGMHLRIARREISVVRLGKLVRMPKTEVDRLLSENLVPARRR